MEAKLKKTRKLILKLLKKLKRSDLEWTIQPSMNSPEPDVIKYSAWIASPNDRVFENIIFSEYSWEDLWKRIENFTNNVNDENIAIMKYEELKRQRESDLKMIEEHLEKLKSPEQEEEKEEK